MLADNAVNNSLAEHWRAAICEYCKGYEEKLRLVQGLLHLPGEELVSRTLLRSTENSIVLQHSIYLKQA